MNKIAKNNFFKYLLFTICFWILIGPLIYKISKLGLASFGGWDAVTQHFPVFLYISRLLKNLISSLFQGAGFTLPLIEWNIGMGDDVITSLNWYGFGDPFYLLTIFVREEYLPYFFTFLFYFRVYLGGIAFISLTYELNNKHSNLAYVIGALIYSFTGFTVQCNIHIIFVHAMMYIPLLLLGAERTMQNKKKWVLSLTVFLFALSGFYYLYIGSITLAVYIIYRFIRKSQQQRLWKWKLIFVKTGEMIAEYIVGLGLSAVIFVPAVLGFLTSNRASVKVNVSLFMSWSEIKSFWINFFLPQYDNYQVLSICTIGVMSVLFTMLARRKGVEKINMILLFLCAFIPMVSVEMSGFGAYYDRWEVVITLYFAYLTVELWDELDELSWVQKIGGFVLFLILGIWGKRLDIIEHERYGVTLFSYGILLMTIFVILPICKRMNKRKIGFVILFVVSVITIGKNWRGVARDKEIACVGERNVVSELIEDEADDFYRVDNERTWSEPRNGQNIALTLGYHGISEYMSIENPSFTNGLVEWNVSPDAFLNIMNVGFDSRGILETLSSVKYMIKREDTTSPIPYGFMKVKVTEDGQWSLYENIYALPIIYSYDSIFDENVYQEMHGFEKQQVMLQAAATENYQGELRKVTEVENGLKELNYSIASIEGGTSDGNTLQLDAGGKITLNVKLRANGENYLIFENVEFDNNLTVEIPEYMSKSLTLTSGYHNGNIGVNLGIMEEDVDKQIILTFQDTETFDLSQMKILYYDFKDYDKYIDDLKEKTLTNLTVGTNKVSCSVSLDKQKMLCVAVPYSEGWTAYVDGHKTEIYRVNDMFMGVEVPEGNHVIVMKYITPGLKCGIVVSLLSFIGILTYFGLVYKEHFR